MKKIILSAFVGIGGLLPYSDVQAQSTFTADFEMFFRNGNNFTVEPGDTLPVNFSVVNHGPDDVDTSNLVTFGITGIPSNLFLIIQSEDGVLTPIADGDSLDCPGIQFIHNENYERDTTFDYCFFMRLNDYPDSFVYDPNQLNDTLCFSVTFKKSEPIGIFDRGYSAGALQIAPNPATDRVNIPMQAFANREATLRIYSFDGRLTHQQKVPAGNKDRVQLDIHSWPKGMYMVEVQSDNERRRGRFVVQ